MHKGSRGPAPRVLAAYNKPEPGTPPRKAGRKGTDGDSDRDLRGGKSAYGKKQQKPAAPDDTRRKRRTKTPTNVKSAQPSKKHTPLKTGPKPTESVEAEMRKYIEEIPLILERREQRAGTDALAAKRAGREKNRAENSRMTDVKKRREEVALNDKKIREMNKVKFRKRSEAYDFPYNPVVKSDQAKVERNKKPAQSPVQISKKRSLSEEHHTTKQRKLSVPDKKSAGKAKRQEKSAERKKNQANIGRPKKRSKRQKRTKSSDGLMANDHEIIESLRHVPALSYRDVKPDSQSSIRRALLDFPSSPPLSSTPSHGEVYVGDMVTADFPMREEVAERKNELKRRLVALRERVEEVQEANSERVSHSRDKSTVSVVKAKDLQEIIRTEAAVKIQSNIRRFLAQRRVERLLEVEDFNSQTQESQDEVDTAEPVLGRFRTEREELFSRPNVAASVPFLPPALQQFEAKLRAEQLAKELEIARLKEANKRLTQEKQRDTSPEDCVKLLVTTKEHELSQLQELMQTKCGSRVDLVEEMSAAFESMLERRYRQLLLMFSQNRERLQTALKTAPSELEDSVLRPEKHSRPKEAEEDLSLDAFLRQALGTVETDRIEAAAARHTANLLSQAERQAEIELSALDSSAPHGDQPFDVATPDLSVIPIVLETDEDRLSELGSRPQRTESPEPDNYLQQAPPPFHCSREPDKPVEEPMKPLVPLKPAERPVDPESSSDLEDLLHTPAYVPLKPPQKPQPPRPKKPVTDSPSALQDAFHIPDGKEPSAVGLDENPFESSQELSLLSLSDVVSPKSDGPQRSAESLVNELTEEILSQLLLESFPKPPSRMPPLNLRNLTPEKSPQGHLARLSAPQLKAYVSTVLAAAGEQALQTALLTPVQLDPVDVLGQLQDIEMGPLISVDLTKFPVVKEEVFAKVEGGDDFSNYGDQTPTTNSIIRDSMRYQHRLLFDCVNESLQKHRVYGEKCAPLPWSQRCRSLGTKPAEAANVQGQVTAQLLKWAAFHVGKIPEGRLLLSSGGVDEEHLQNLREEKLSKMLTADILESEEGWVEYEAEETQSKIDLADMVLEEILDEVEVFLKSLNN